MSNGKLLSRSKRLTTDGRRLSDKEFDELHCYYIFTMEGCCDSLGLNGITKGYLSILKKILYYLTMSRDSQFIVTHRGL